MGDGVIRGTTLHHPPLPPLGGHVDHVLLIPQVAPELADAIRQRWNVTTWIIHIRNLITISRTLTSVLAQVFTIIRLCLISLTVRSVY